MHAPLETLHDGDPVLYAYPTEQTAFVKTKYLIKRPFVFSLPPPPAVTTGLDIS